MTAVLLNTVGGVTGGDTFETRIRSGARTQLTVTTQFAERAYRAQPGEYDAIDTRLTLDHGSRLDWLPQETLLFDKAALSRRLRVEIPADAICFLVEPVILGRVTMGETVRELDFGDCIDVIRDGKLIFADRSALFGNPETILAGTANGGGARAMASVLFAAPDAETALDAVRDMLPPTAGIAAPVPGLLFALLLATDGFGLRQPNPVVLDRDVVSRSPVPNLDDPTSCSSPPAKKTNS